jgi:hypothetical protein
MPPSSHVPKLSLDSTLIKCLGGVIWGYIIWVISYISIHELCIEKTKEHKTLPDRMPCRFWQARNLSDKMFENIKFHFKFVCFRINVGFKHTIKQLKFCFVMQTILFLGFMKWISSIFPHLHAIITFGSPFFVKPLKNKHRVFITVVI